MSAYVVALGAKLAPITLERWRNTFRMFARFLVDEYGDTRVTVDMLSIDMLTRFYAWLQVGRHEAARGLNTKKRIVTRVQTTWAWLFSSEWHPAVPRAKTIEMRKLARTKPQSATWAEMITVVTKVRAEARRLATILFYTGVRTMIALTVTWEAIDLERGSFSCPPQKGLPGYTIPLSRHFLALLKTWAREPHEPTDAVCAWPVGHTRAETVLREAWKAAGVREVIWHRAPGKAFRRGVTSGLKQLGADKETAELYVGRGVEGARAHYLDLGLVPFAPVAKLFPKLPRSPK